MYMYILSPARHWLSAGRRWSKFVRLCTHSRPARRWLSAGRAHGLSSFVRRLTGSSPGRNPNPPWSHPPTWPAAGRLQ